MTIPINIFFRLSLNSIVDIHDDKYMDLLHLSSEATEALKNQFKTSQLVVPSPNDRLVELYKRTDNVIHQYINISIIRY